MSENVEPETKRKPRWRRWLLEALIAVAIFAGVSAWRAADLAEGEAPPITGVTLEGERFDLARFRGEPVAVYFWATWCPVCKANSGAMESVSEDAQFISVAMQSGERNEVGEYVTEHGVEYPVIVDSSGALANAYAVKGVPTVFVIDGEGEIRFATVGYTSAIGLRLRLWFAAMS